MIKNNTCLSVLFLHWNFIKGKGSAQLAEALCSNETLLVFDSSFNSFGSSENNESSKAWRRAFAINKTLLHVDLSQNGFKYQDMKIIGNYKLNYNKINS